MTLLKRGIGEGTARGPVAVLMEGARERGEESEREEWDCKW